MLINGKQKIILETDAKINGIERVSVWLYNAKKNSITSNIIYSLSKNEYLPGLSFSKKDFPNYFKALQNNSIIDAHDAINDPRTSDFNKSYLKPLGITSILNAPIKIGGKVIGVVCHEHIGTKRVWSKEAQLYATSVADIFALEMESAEQEDLFNELLESEQRFTMALIALPVIFWTTDSELRITSSRGEGLTKVGFNKNWKNGTTLYEYFQTLDSEFLPIAAHLKSIKGESLKYDYEFNEHFFEAYIEPLRNNANDIIGCSGMALNLTERKNAVDIIRKREQQLSSIFDTVADSIFVLEVEKDGNYRYDSVNKSYLNTTGFQPNQIIGKRVHENTPDSFLQFVLNKYQTAIQEKKIVFWEETNDFPNGRLTGIVSIAPLFDNNGTCVQLIGSVKDITERKINESELRKKEERFRLLAETTNIIPWETDAKTFQYTYVGPQAEEILGYPAEEWYTEDFWSKNIHPKDRQKALEYINESYKTKEDYQLEYRMIAKNGETVWFHDVVTVETKNNEPVLLRGYLINITSRKLIEEKIQKLNIELEQRVEERTAQLQATNLELEKAKILAEESSVAKELFLASMSHEIRTPLNAIIGFQQLLKDTSLTEEQYEFVESIDFAGRNLLVIVNDILDISKIEAGKFEFDEAEFNISDIMRSVVELVEFRAEEKNLKLFFSHDSKIPKYLYGDSTRLSQILLNLIGNAIKFTERGEVKISTKQLDTTNDFVICEFMVEDTGIGIPKDKLAYIFERFSQENTSISRKYGGTGLGLTISKHLVEMQGGTIQVQSQKGKGSKFSFQLKFKKEPSKNHNPELKRFSPFEPTKKGKKLKILLAEDAILNQRLIVKLMEKWGHDLDIAENGKIAVDKVKKHTYDMILMDIQMPIMDGYHATSFIRSLPDIIKQSIPIIALTAHASHAEAEKCINLGMNAYLAKPFNQDHLLQLITQLTNGK